MAVGRGGDTARTVWKAVGDVSGRPGSRAGLRRRGRADRSTRAKGLPARGTRRQPAPRPPRPVHGPRRPLAPAHSTNHDARSFAPKRTPLAAARWERARGAAGHRFRHTTLGSGSTGSGSESTRRCRTKPATSSAAAVPQHQAASSAGSNTRRRKPAPLAPAHVAATGGRSTKSGGERRGGAETAPSQAAPQMGERASADSLRWNLDLGPRPAGRRHGRSARRRQRGC